MDEIRTDAVQKKTNPIERSNVLSRLFFCWLLPYFVRGYRSDLGEDDMYKHRPRQESGRLGDRLEAAWDDQVKRKRNPSLVRALMKVFAVEYFLLVLVAVFSEAIRMYQPLLISQLLAFYDDNMADENKDQTYFYAGMIVLTAFINVICMQYFNFMMMQIGMEMRVASCSLIYRKSLKLSKSALAETTIGQMVNLLSNDVNRFDAATHFMHQLIFGPVETFIVMYLCYTNVGWSGLVGAMFLLVSIPFQSYLGKKTSQFRLGTAIRTDERVRLMNEIISGIQVIKMYTWEKPFAKLVEMVRLREIKFIRYTSYIRAIMMSCSMFLNRSAVFLCILTHTLSGRRLSSSYAYTISSFYRLLGSVTMFFPQAVTQFSEMLISIKRIRQFLLYEELLLDQKVDFEIGKYTKNGNSELKGSKVEVGISLKGVSVKWLKSLPETNLEEVNLEVKPGELVAVVGPVGSGKSTLLHVILGELPPIDGVAEINGIVSYASQEPWLFGGSVRQNILFGLPYDELKYNEVVRVCALERDFTLFPHGDRTLVGERGVSLSGGQRARINLARAVYKDADIYLLDDPLSAVDTHVGKQLFEECVCGYLSRKCVILVTHQLQYLKKVGNILLLQDGKVFLSGSYEDMKNSDSEFTQLLADIEEEEEESRRKSRMSMKKEEEEARGKDEIQTLGKEEKGTGTISWYVYKSFVLAGGHWVKVLVLALLFFFAQLLDSSLEYYVTLWVNTEQSHLTAERAFWSLTPPPSHNLTRQEPLNETIPHDPITTVWDPIFYSSYTNVYYSVLFVIAVCVIFSRSISLYSWCITASTRLHNRMFDNIVYSPMRFFNLNPSGRILNRFSRDIGAVDETLPMTLLDTIQIGLTALAITLVIGSLSPFIFIPTVGILTLFYCMRVVFLATSRNVKRVESITRSPIYTHLSATLQGLTTIRAFRAQEILKVEFDNYQNLHSAAFFLFLGANRTFGFWLDFICVVYVALVVVFLLFVNSESMGGNVGLGLTQAMALTGMFQWGMRQWSELENQMTSVERVQEYADLKPEQDGPVKEPPKNWPSDGKIEFKDMNLRYAPEDPPVLKDLNFTIEPKEKVGIVGRTGAGKSSLIQALFRLAEIYGSIYVDGVDTKSISRRRLRSRISIIPQEPVLFSSTLRKNLDPFDDYSDEVLWSALEEVELKPAVEDLPAGLDSKMAEGGSNFSVGQRQLVCLARAIVRNNKILVLDEATANVDPHTDALIQKTIRVKFADCTVLTIAHRLHTIMDSDKVLVMDAGEAAQFGHPHELLSDESGIFYSLVTQTGRATAKHLMSIAEETYNKE